MAQARKKKAARKSKKKRSKRFAFQLSLGGVVSIAVVCFCLFLWMFLLGIWAGQTILLPADDGPAVGDRGRTGSEESRLPVKRLHPDRRKTPVNAKP